jgi:hydroxyacylglutathione hydrolase
VRGLTEVAPGILVATSSYDQTTSTVVVGSDGSGGCLLIDPAVTAAELARLAADLREQGLRPVAGWSTHPHWDHVLWLRELGGVPRYATPAAAAFALAERAELARETQRSAPGHDFSLLGRLAADAAYLDALARGRPFGDPRLTDASPGWLRDTHDEQLRYVRGPGS